MPCTFCLQESKVIPEKSSLALQCGHMIQCTECRDYNLEKIMRCEKCCRDILGCFIEGCSENCARNTSTVKASALCAVCGSHLRKEAKCCRGSDSLKETKKLLRSCMTVLVQRPTLIKNPSPKDRPCSHYTLCQYCKTSVIKGHRSSTVCKVCKNLKKRPLDTLKDAEIPNPKKQCTLGALAEIADEIDKKQENEPKTNSNNSNDIPKTETTEKNGLTGLRFGPKCGAPIWALVNPSCSI